MTATLRDDLRVGKRSHLILDPDRLRSDRWEESWVLYHRGPDALREVATFPREDEAWGAVSLILEYAERYDFPVERAIWQAMEDYHEALRDPGPFAVDNEPDADELGRMAHAHSMATYPH